MWGRDEPGTGEMWNSNSVIAWVLAQAGLSAASVAPRLGGRARGWNAGLEVARRRRGRAVGARAIRLTLQNACAPVRAHV